MIWIALHFLIQGPLELLWMVYSEVKLQLCFKLRNFQTPFHKDKSVVLYDLYMSLDKFILAVESSLQKYYKSVFFPKAVFEW